jgi:hypothetical protein
MNGWASSDNSPKTNCEVENEIRRTTRRRLFAEVLGGAGVGVVALAGCGGGAARSSGAGAGVSDSAAGRPGARPGSTLTSTWGDPTGDGQLGVGPGEPFVHRTELGSQAPASGLLATIAHITDAHVLDASSPARVTFLDRLGQPFESTFRPQEALTVQVLAGAAAAVRALAPDLVIQGGDLIDNAQGNELTHALAVLAGGIVRPGSGPDGYYGVQLGSDPDPFYYRPDVDAPQHPGLLREAVAPFSLHGLGVPWVPVLGDHDALVAGELVPNDLTRSLALGDRALWDLPAGLSLPPGFDLGPAGSGDATSPDGPPDPALVGLLLQHALSGPTVTVPPDPARQEMSFAEVIARLRAGAGASGAGVAMEDGSRMDYVVDLGPRLRLLVLDLARRNGGSGGLVVSGQPGWVAAQLSGAAAADRWVMIVSHQALWDSTGGDQILGLLDGAPQVIATLSGHTHRSRIRPQATSSGGYWQIETASLVDYPQQARALRVLATADGGIAIQTWMLDHVFPGPLGTISRELSYLDAQGGRPQRFAGARIDRNAILYLRRPA